MARRTARHVVQMATHVYADVLSNIAASLQRLVEIAAADPQGSSSLSGEAIAEAVVSTGMASFAVSETTPDSLTVTGAASHSLSVEATSDQGASGGTAGAALGEAVAETDAAQETASQQLALDATAEGASTIGAGSQDALNENDPLTSSATSKQNTVEEVDQAPPAGTQTAGEAIAEQPTQQETGVQSVSAEASADSGTSTGTGAPSATDATAEADSSQGTDSPSLVGADADDVRASATDSPSLLEATSDAETQQQTGDPEISSAEAQPLDSSGSGSHSATDATADIDAFQGTGTPTLSDREADSITASARSTQNAGEEVDQVPPGSVQGIGEAIAEALVSTGTESDSISESVPFDIDSIDNVGAGSQSFVSAEADGPRASGDSSLTAGEALAETDQSASSSSQALSASDAELIDASAHGVHAAGEASSELLDTGGTESDALLDIHADAGSSSGSGSQSQGEAVAESALQAQSSAQSLDEVIISPNVEDVLFTVAIASQSAAEALAEGGSNAGLGDGSALDGSDDLRSSALSMQAIDEVITGTPEPIAEASGGGGGGDLITMWGAGPPPKQIVESIGVEDELVSVSLHRARIEELVLVADELVNVMAGDQGYDGAYRPARRPVKPIPDTAGPDEVARRIRMAEEDELFQMGVL